jgi:hypothetical protein
MPSALASKPMLFWGVILTAVGLLARLFLVGALGALWGNGALNNAALSWAHTLVGVVAFQFGLALIAFSFVAQAVEALSTRSDRAREQYSPDDITYRTAASPAPAAKRMFWLGVALTLLGLVLQRWLDAWSYDLSGGADVGGGLARDILLLVGPALEALAFPLGILLVAASLVVRLLERVAAVSAASPSDTPAR